MEPVLQNASHKLIRLSPADLPRLLPPRPQRSSKGAFGRVVTVCGSSGMSGAAYLAAHAAYRVGCGLVEIITPEENRTILQTLLPEAIVTCYDSDSPNNSRIAAALSRADAAVIGCGLGTSATACEVLETSLISLRCHAVLDADALNILAARPALWGFVPCGTIITPHPGEAARLTGLDIDRILRNVPEVAQRLAAEHDIICVLKDHKSIISSAQATYINEFGNSGMATAGSGDVLAGAIAGLLAQAGAQRWLAPLSDATEPAHNACNMCDCSTADCSTAVDSLTTAALGVLLHSLAGDAAAARLTEYSVMAGDIIAALPEVLADATRSADR